jgi:uncharacterized membrane protein YhhN
MQLYLAIAFSIAAVITAVLHIQPTLLRAADRPYLYGPLTVLCLAIVALLAPVPLTLFYKGAMLFGLLVTGIGVLLLTLPGMPPAAGLAHLLIVYLVYFWAFAAQSQLRLPTFWVLFVPLFGGVLYLQIAPRLFELRGAVLAYLTLLLLICWQAVELWAQTGTRWAGLGLAGAIFLLAANTFLLLDAFRTPIRGAQTLIAVCFYLGHLLLAWSTWGGVD